MVFKYCFDKYSIPLIEVSMVRWVLMAPPPRQEGVLTEGHGMLASRGTHVPVVTYAPSLCPSPHTHVQQRQQQQVAAVAQLHPTAVHANQGQEFAVHGFPMQFINPVQPAAFAAAAGGYLDQSVGESLGKNSLYILTYSLTVSAENSREDLQYFKLAEISLRLFA